MDRLLVVLDSLGSSNGAHVATRAMIAALRGCGVTVDLLLGNRAEDMTGIEGVTQHELSEPTRGFRWLVQGVYRRLKFAPVPRWVLDPWGKARRLMRKYDTVLVVGENSHFRWLVAGLKGPRKAVFIHTDYVSWKTSCDWAVEDSRFDRQIYRGFDVIAVVGQANADRFAAYYPEFASKTRAFHNLFYGKKVEVEGGGGQRCGILHLVTVSRLEWGAPKMTERIVRVAGELKRRGCSFDWTVYGKGTPADEARLKDLARQENVDDVLHFAGFTNDVRGVLSNADLHVLLSAYEGAPNVIIEAQQQGVPCISTDVGAAREMIADGKSGLVIRNSEQAIVDGMERALKDAQMQTAWKDSLEGYRYDNDKVMQEYGKILELHL